MGGDVIKEVSFSLFHFGASSSSFQGLLTFLFGWCWGLFLAVPGIKSFKPPVHKRQGAPPAQADCALPSCTWQSCFGFEAKMNFSSFQHPLSLGVRPL